jgi:hypothetical protein
MKSNYDAEERSGLYARIAIADLALGVYDFRVVKTYPNGRVETTSDKAEVTGLDGNQVALFGATTTVGVNNPKFRDNFLINEAAYIKGQYKFEFTIGTITKTYIVDVIDEPKLVVEEIKIGSTAGALLATTFTFEGAKAYTAAKLTLDFTLQNLTEDNFLSIKVVEDNTGTDITPGAGDLYTGKADGFGVNTLIYGREVANSTSKISLKDLETLVLGDIRAGANTVYADNDRITIEVYFWKKVDRSESADRYVQVGEKQTIQIGFKAPVAA